MPTFNVLLFAVARERVGARSVAVTLPTGSTVAALRAEIARRYPILHDLLPSVAVAVDCDFAADDAILPDDAEPALIPPVSGGAG